MTLYLLQVTTQWWLLIASGLLKLSLYSALLKSGRVFSFYICIYLSYLLKLLEVQFYNATVVTAGQKILMLNCRFSLNESLLRNKVGVGNYCLTVLDQWMNFNPWLSRQLIWLFQWVQRLLDSRPRILQLRSEQCAWWGHFWSLTKRRDSGALLYSNTENRNTKFKRFFPCCLFKSSQM